MKTDGRKNYLSVRETASRLDISRQWVRALVNEGTFKDVRRGLQRSYWISETEVNEKMKTTPGRNRLLKMEA